MRIEESAEDRSWDGAEGGADEGTGLPWAKVEGHRAGVHRAGSGNPLPIVQGLATRKWERDHEWKLRILIREVNQLGAFYGLSSAGLFCAFGLGAAYERMACSAMPSASGIKVK